MRAYLMDSFDSVNGKTFWSTARAIGKDQKAENLRISNSLATFSERSSDKSLANEFKRVLGISRSKNTKSKDLLKVGRKTDVQEFF